MASKDPPRRIDDRIAVARGSHAARAHGMKHARDVVVNVLGKRRIVLDERGEIEAPIRQAREDRAGERRHDIDERGDERALDPVCRSDSVETPQAVIELHWKSHAAHRPYFLVCQNVDRAAEALLETRQVELVPKQVELDAGPAGIARRERHAAARHRLEQSGRQVGDLGTERAPRSLALHVDVHVGRGRAGKAGGVTQCGHRMRPHGGGLPVMAMLQ